VPKHATAYSYLAAGCDGRFWPISDTRASRPNVHCALIANIRRAHSIVADAVLRAVRSYVEREADGADIGSVATKKWRRGSAHN
jgi:hypothetical protein